MDIGKVGSLYITGTEKYIAGNDMVFTAVFKKPFHQKKLYESYRELILNNPPMHSVLVWQKNKKRFTWKRIAPEKLENLLIHEKKRLEHMDTAQRIYSEYYPTNQRLPFRLTPINKRTIVFSVNHAYTNGPGGLAWIEKWLCCYGKSVGINVGKNSHCGNDQANQPTKGIDHLSHIKALLWTILYVIQFLWQDKMHSNAKTVDLTHGKIPCKNKTGFSVRTCSFSTQETRHIMEKRKIQGQTLSEFLLTDLAEFFFKHTLKGNRLCISVPFDMRSCVPHITAYSLGNYTGSLIVQLFKGENILHQVRAAFSRINQKVPYGLTRMSGLIMHNELTLKKHFEKQTTLPIQKRAPFENFTLAFSNMGILRSPVLRTMFDRFSGHAKTQTIFLGAIILHERLTLEVCVSNDLFQPDEVFGLLNKYICAMKKPEHSQADMQPKDIWFKPHSEDSCVWR